MNNKVERILIYLVLAGNFLAQGLYFPSFNYLPIYLIFLIILGIFELVNWFSSHHGKLYLRCCNGIPLIVILIYLNVVLVYLVNFIFDFKALTLILFTMLFGLACFNTINNEADLFKLLNVFVCLVVFSSLVEIGQFFEIPFCRLLWTVTHISDRLDQAIAEGRYIGMASDAVQFGYQCTAAIAILLFSNYNRKFSGVRIIALIIISFALLTNNTRSAQICMALLLCIWLFSDKSIVKNKTFRVILGAIVICIFCIYIPNSELFKNSRFITGAESAGTKARIPMILTAFNHAFYYPFGMGEYIVNPSLVIGIDNTTLWSVVHNGAHNILGNCVASFGFLGLFLMILLYYKIYKLYTDYRCIKSVSLLYMASFYAIVVLFINSFFHNSYILNGDFSSWFFIGVLLSKSKLINLLSEEESSEKSK